MPSYTIRFLFLVGALALTESRPVSAAEHPAQGGRPMKCTFYEADTSPRPAESVGDLTFIGRDDKPAWSALTQMEQYMLGGVEGRPRTGKVMLPWHMEVYAVAARYWAEYGRLPDVLDESEIRRVPGFAEAQGVQIEELRNPLTGAWPRLNAVVPSPGDFYMRPLTDAEMQHFAELCPSYRRHWFEGKAFDADHYSAGVPWEQCWTRDRELATRPFYVRMYGSNGPILTMIEYYMRPAE